MNSEFEELSEMDLWRLADNLSVADAAMLISGYSPSDRYLSLDGDYRFTGDNTGKKQRFFTAAFSSLRGAILSNKLAADVKVSMRSQRVASSQTEDEVGTYNNACMPHEEQVSYDMLISRNDTSARPPSPIDGQTRLNFSQDDLRTERFLYICREPNWDETLIDVEALKLWLKNKGISPTLFFPRGHAQGFKDKGHARYSPKLACAVAAWEAVKVNLPNQSVKQSLENWVQSNGVTLGLGKDGFVSPTAAQEVAKIANWDTSGGANRTPTPSVETPTIDRGPIENYGYGYQEHPEKPDMDDETPF